MSPPVAHLRGGSEIDTHACSFQAHHRNLRYLPLHPYATLKRLDSRRTLFLQHAAIHAHERDAVAAQRAAHNVQHAREL